MQCPQCEGDNKAGRKFCAACGHALPSSCAQCGFLNDPGDRFCGGCRAALVPSSTFQVPGSQSPDAGPRTSDLGLSSLQTADPGHWTPPHLAERIRVEQAALEARGATEGERKTVTALFADITNSMGLIEDLDPEEARALIDPAIQLMMDAVHRYEGYVVQYTGDGIFALFGAPLAHEDHPQRALYAALRMQEEMKRYADHLRLEQGVPLQIRVGLNTGEVVMRAIRKDDLHTDYTSIGHSTSLAARMESLATPGSIVVSEQTYKLTEGYFEFKALGAAKVKGVSEPVQIYEVVGVGPLRTRLQVAARRGLTRFVGRQSEMEQMRRAFAQARAGQGQIVGVMGEPGLGKSRLFHEFVGATHASPLRSQYDCLVLETFSVSHGKAYAYLPLIDLLKHYFQLTPQDDERQRREKVGGRVLMLDRNLEDTLPYFFALLGMGEPTSSLTQMDPQIRKRRTFEAIKRLLVRESLNQPLILIFEDLHWLDNETQAFLTLLSESLASARILLLVNYRPEYRHGWGNKTFYTQVRLDPLGQEDAQDLLTTLLGSDVSLPSLKQLILEKTQGNPFFMEEIVQALVEQGVLTGLRRGGSAHHPVDLAQIHLPATVQAVLAARIDRLPHQEKSLLQTLAVIGKEFPFSLLKHVVKQSEDLLRPALSHLQEAEFIYEQPAFPEVEYTFKHALTQEVAYNSVLIERRKSLHEQTGQALEVLFHSRLEDHYGDLAHHYMRGGNSEKAIEYLRLAGQQAVQRSASAEAVSHLTTALELLPTLPDTLDRARQELTLQLALGAPLMATKGPMAVEVEATYTRARALCQQVGETPQLFPALRGLWWFYFAQGELQTAHALGDQLFRVAQQAHDPALLLEAHHVLGAILSLLGEFAPAREHLEQGIALYDPKQHHALAFLYGLDPGVVCLSRVAGVWWQLGYPDQALKRSRAALTLAQELAHTHSLAFALSSASMHHLHRREWRVSQERAEALIALSREQGFAHFLTLGTIMRGGALIMQGQEEEGITQLRQVLAAERASVSAGRRVLVLMLLAEAQGKVGQAEEGLALLAEALAVADKLRPYEAEMYRLKGELTLKQSEVRGPRSEVDNPQSAFHNPQLDAEACFLKAIEVARRQQAKSLELRATVSLARLWQRQGKTTAAQQMLAEIYGWFTEGFDTADLQEAKALLEELA